MTIETDLRQAARRTGLSDKDLAERLGVSRQCVSRWLTRRQVVGISHLRPLARILEIPVEQILPPTTESAPNE